MADTDTDTNTEVWRYNIDASGMDAKPALKCLKWLRKKSRRIVCRVNDEFRRVYMVDMVEILAE